MLFEHFRGKWKLNRLVHKGKFTRTDHFAKNEWMNNELMTIQPLKASAISTQADRDITVSYLQINKSPIQTHCFTDTVIPANNRTKH